MFLVFYTLHPLSIKLGGQKNKNGNVPLEQEILLHLKHGSSHTTGRHALL